MSLPRDEQARIAGLFMQHVMPEVQKEVEREFLSQVMSGSSNTTAREQAYYTLRAAETLRAAITRFINKAKKPEAPVRTEPV